MMPRQEDGSLYEFDVLAAGERDEVSRVEEARLAEASPEREGSGALLGRHGAVQGDLRTIRVGSVMSLCPEPLRVRDTVATALKQMGGQRQWYLPIVCEDGLFLGALDVSDICLWLGGSLTQVSVEAFFAGRS